MMYSLDLLQGMELQELFWFSQNYKTNIYKKSLNFRFVDLEKASDRVRSGLFSEFKIWD